MISSNFREWDFDKIDEAFGTMQTFQSSALDQWLNYTYNCSDYEKKYIEQLQETLLLGVNDWNEVELENKFISPLIVFAQFDNPNFAYFLERPLSVTINNYELSGIVDGMIATGFRNPKKPYFCLTEYKRQTDPSGNPQGQTLIAMLAAQTLNGTPKQPIYGCFIIGKFWQFMVLEGKNYTLSQSFHADDDEVFDIYRLLQGLKSNIIAQLNANK
jgi:hypothetical protein